MSEKSLYQLQSKQAQKDITLDDVCENPSDIRMFPDKEESEVLGWLDTRFQLMDDSRPDEEWEVRQRQFEALTLWNDDGTAETNMPIERTTIRNKMADALSDRPLITLRPQEKDDIDKVDLTKVIWDFVWNESDTDKELFDLFLMCYIFGTAFWFEGMHKEIKTEYIPKVGNDGLITSTSKLTTLSWLKGFALDIRDVYIDPVHDLEVASDCFILERDISRERLDNLRYDPNYFNIDRALNVSNRVERRKKSFTTLEEAHVNDCRHDKFTLYHYYNKEKGIYIVTVDNEVVIREGATPFAHGQLPISALIDHKDPRELYGTGECELLESTKYERNEIRNQIIDQVRRSNDIRIALGKNISLEDSGFIDNVTQVMSFDGDLNQFQYMKQPSQDSGLFNVEDKLQNDATWITGIDNNALAGSPTKTAFEARLQEQTKLKGINVSLKLADFFYTRMARQRLANIQFWLPITTGRKIVGTSKFRTIPIEDKEKKTIKRFVKGEVKETGIKFKIKKGANEFIELKPEMIRSNLDVTVETPSTTPILKELDKQELQLVFQNVVEAAQLDPEILKSFDVMKYLTERIKQVGKDPDDFFQKGDDTKNMQDLRESIIGDLPLPYKPSNQPERAELNPILQNPEAAQVAQAA